MDYEREAKIVSKAQTHQHHENKGFVAKLNSMHLSSHLTPPT